MSDPFSRKIALNTPLRRAANSTVACMFRACMGCNKRVAWVYKKTLTTAVCTELSLLSIKTKLNYFRQKQLHAVRHYQMNTKQSSWMYITASLMLVLQNMKTNDGTECIEKQSTHSVPPLTHRGWFASTSPIRESNGSDGRQPTSSDCACCLEQITSVRLRKLPTQLNTPNIFVLRGVTRF